MKYLHPVYDGLRWLAGAPQADNVNFNPVGEKGLGLSLYPGLAQRVVGVYDHTVSPVRFPVA
jgi:hypothetical protein